MGRGGGNRWKGRGGRAGRGRGRGSHGGGQQPYASYPEIIKEHKILEAYYNALLKFPEEEQALFWETLRRELPNSFRFCGSKSHALAVRKLLLERYIPEIEAIGAFEGRKFDPPKPISFYPDELAWTMTTPKQVIRRHPPFAAFQKFLVSETNVGNITRQEAVSMIPPLLMDVRPGMTVLDLCAAPGSKASQLLEMIHAGEEARTRAALRGEESTAIMDDASDNGRATGLLIANDADYKRAQMLVHQLKRISSPNTIVTNHDATMFPSIKLPSHPSDSKKGHYLKFDRILADVPCSGDGTLRKNVTLWHEWSANNAAGLHMTQVRILVRALQLLKVGGRVVYSTCSMNPIENEAVVYSAIERCGGISKVGIVDCSSELPKLKRRPGMKSWLVVDKAGNMFASLKEFREAVDNEKVVAPDKFVDTMFPREDAESSNVPIDRCMRVYPHLQDTGAFFITVLEKKSEIKAKNESGPKSVVSAATKTVLAEETEAKSPTQHDVVVKEVHDFLAGPMAAQSHAITQPVEEINSLEIDSPGLDQSVPTISDAVEPCVVGAKRRADEELEQNVPSKKARPSAGDEDGKDEEDDMPTAAPQKFRGHNEDPFKYLSPDHEVLLDIKKFFNISEKFPMDRFMVRNAACEPSKAIYYTSALVRDIFRENETRAVKFVHGGVKLFVKQEAPSPGVCRWRIQSDGLQILDGYVGENRVVYLHKKETLHKLLIEMFPVFKEDEWKSLGEIGERVRDIGMGCCVMRIEPSGDDPTFMERLVVPLWKSIHSLNLMLPKEERSAMLLRIYNDTSPLVNMPLKNSEEKKRQQQQQQQKFANEAINGDTKVAEHQSGNGCADGLENKPIANIDKNDFNGEDLIEFVDRSETRQTVDSGSSMDANPQTNVQGADEASKPPSKLPKP